MRKISDHILGTDVKLRTNSYATLYHGLQHMDELVLANQQILIYTLSVWTLDAVSKTCLGRWTIELDGEKEP